MPTHGEGQPTDPVQARLAEVAPLAEAVRAALQAQVDRLGFPGGSVTVGDPAEAGYRLELDPASGDYGLLGEWRDPRGQKLGGLVFHADGSFFVEYDVIRSHPRRPGWFVEAVNAWGRGDDIRAEPRLCPWSPEAMAAPRPPSGTDSPWALYDLLIGAAPGDTRAAEVLIGLTWTLCRGEDGGLGLAMSPGVPIRTLPWPGTLAGRPLHELATWLRSWDPYEATVGMAAVNALWNLGSDLAASALPLRPAGPANLAVFEHFRAQVAGQRVVVVGRYPGLEGLDLGWDLSVLERSPGPGDHPDPAAEYLLPEADWVFLTATSIVNKTFPRLAELARPCPAGPHGPDRPLGRGAGRLGRGLPRRGAGAGPRGRARYGGGGRRDSPVRDRRRLLRR